MLGLLICELAVDSSPPRTTSGKLTRAGFKHDRLASGFATCLRLLFSQGEHPCLGESVGARMYLLAISEEYILGNAFDNFGRLTTVPSIAFRHLPLLDLIRVYPRISSLLGSIDRIAAPPR